jgi:hypothetical protein
VPSYNVFTVITLGEEADSEFDMWLTRSLKSTTIFATFFEITATGSRVSNERPIDLLTGLAFKFRSLNNCRTAGRFLNGTKMTGLHPVWMTPA